MEKEHSTESEPFLGSARQQDSEEETTHSDDSSESGQANSPIVVVRRRWHFLAGLVVLLLVTATSISVTPKDVLDTLSRYRNRPLSCRDPYTLPGYALRTTNRTMIRWIPFYDYIEHEVVTEKSGKGSIDHIPDYALEHAPPSLSLLLMDEKTRGADERLDFLRNRTIALVGCSLDRNAFESMCKLLGKGNKLHIDSHGLSTCIFPDLDLHIEVWFHFGVVENELIEGQKYRFERRMTSMYLSHAKKRGKAPDLILFASGTWDQRSLLGDFRPEEDLKATKQVDSKHAVPVLPWEAYVYYRSRLREMSLFLREHFPEAALMFRPMTYTRDSKNGLTYEFRESAIATMQSLNVPIFTWAEKLIGELDMYDETHFRQNSGADWLYGDMLFYYLQQHVERKGFC